LSIGSGGIGIAGLTPGGISSSTNDEIVFEPLGVSGTGYCSSGGSCNGLPTSEVGGCTGSVCGCSLGRAGCYSSINQIPGLPQPDQGSSNDGGLNCNLLPSININLPEQTCQNDQCPVYTVTSGILGGFKEKEMELVGRLIAKTLKNTQDSKVQEETKKAIKELLADYPLYPDLKYD